MTTKQTGPVRLPSLILVVGSALPRNGGGKDNYVRKIDQLTDKPLRGKCRQMLSHFEAESKVKPSIYSD
jgi:hypothetical protein